MWGSVLKRDSKIYFDGQFEWFHLYWLRHKTAKKLGNTYYICLLENLLTNFNSLLDCKGVKNICVQNMMFSFSYSFSLTPRLWKSMSMKNHSQIKQKKSQKDFDEYWLKVPNKFFYIFQWNYTPVKTGLTDWFWQLEIKQWQLFSIFLKHILNHQLI